MFKVINIELLLIFSSFISFVFTVWFKTNAVVEYGRLFKLNKILYLDEYEEYVREDYSSGDYISFLTMRKDCFITRLITCPFCLGIWYSFFISLAIGLVYFCLLYLLSLVIYFIIVRMATA